MAAHGHVSASNSGHAKVHAGERWLRLALVLTVAILAVELIGGLLSHSLALVADAGHVLTDVGSLGLALFAARQSHRPADAERTFGYHRVGILVALVNASALIAIALVITGEAVGRFMRPQPVQPAIMLSAAALGLAINLVIAGRLRVHAHRDLNMRGALLHVIGDAGASAGVIVAALIVWLTGWSGIDPILSVAIAGLIAWGAWRILSEVLAVLLEAVPNDIDMPALVHQIHATTGVRDVHDLHVWSIGSGLTMLSCHVRIDDQTLIDGLQIVDRIKCMLGERFGIVHCTIQPETTACVAPDLYCALPCGCHADS